MKTAEEITHRINCGLIENHGLVLSEPQLSFIKAILKQEILPIHASQRDTEPKDIKERIKPYISDEEPVVSKWIREDAEKEDGKGAEEHRINELIHEKCDSFTCDSDQRFVFRFNQIKFMELIDELNNFASLPAKSVTDEDIERWANEYASKTGGGLWGDYYRSACAGAKAHRDGQIPKK